MNLIEEIKKEVEERSTTAKDEKEWARNMYEQVRDAWASFNGQNGIRIECNDGPLVTDCTIYKNNGFRYRLRMHTNGVELITNVIPSHMYRHVSDTKVVLGLATNFMADVLSEKRVIELGAGNKHETRQDCTPTKQ